MSTMSDIKTAALAFWARLTQREQAALSIMGFACAGFAFYLIVALPALAYQKAAQRSLENEGARLGRIMAMLDNVDGGIQANAVDRSKPARTRVVEAARQAGITIDQVEPQTDGFTVYIRNVTAGELFDWIMRIENQQAVPVINAAINKSLNGNTLDAEIGFGDAR